MISSAAYLLVFHGSRDSRTQTAASELKQLITAKCRSINMLAQGNHLQGNSTVFASDPSANSSLKSAPLIEIAALELTAIPLRSSLVNFAYKASQQGITQIRVLPLFLTPGVHVQQDIPAEIAAATNQIGQRVTIKLSPYLGNYSGMVPLLNRQWAKFPTKARILIAHGTKLSLGELYYRNLAQQLDAKLAYWSTTPRCREQIETLIALGHQKIALLPYFLFPGRITAEIAAEVANLQQQYPQVELFLGQPLGATEALAELVMEEILVNESSQIYG